MSRETLPTRTQVLVIGDPFGEADVLDGQTSGISVTSVERGSEAIDRIEEFDVSCVVSHTASPNDDVLDLLDEIRQRSPGLPFVGISHEPESDLAMRLLEYDATDYVVWRGDAYQPRQLSRRIESLVGQYRDEESEDDATTNFETLVRRAPDAILTVDGAGDIVFANPATEDVFGYGPEELVGEPLTAIIPGRLRQSHREAFQRYQETGTKTLDWEYIELPGLHRDGHEVPLALSFRETSHRGEQLFSAVIRDITDRKRSEDERQLLHSTTRSVAEAETFLDGLEAAITEICTATEWAYGEAWVPGDDGGQLQRAPAAHSVDDRFDSFEEISEMTSFAMGEGLPGRVWESNDAVWMENVAELTPGVFPRTREAEVVGLEAALGVPIIQSDEVVAVLTFYMPDERQRDDRLVDIVTTVATNLGELMARKRTEDALKEEKEFTQSALNALPDIFFTLDLEGRLVRWNEEGPAVTGYSDDELAHRYLTELVPDEDAARVADAIQRAFAQGTTRVEARLQTKDGPEIPYEFTAALLENESGETLGIAGIGRDITDRKRRETRLEESREKYRRLVQTAPDAIFIVDVETGVIQNTNRAAEDLLGKSSDEIIGMHQSELHPEGEADRYRRIFDEHVESGGIFRDDDDYYVVDSDGDEIPIEISAGITDLGDKSLSQAIFRDITERKQRERRLEMLRQVTRELMTVETKREICERTLSTIRDILDLPISAIHLLDEDDDVLRPVASTAEAQELFDGVPSFKAEEGLAWRVYAEGEPKLYDDVRGRDEVYNPETPVETEMILPLGDHGILTIGSTEGERLTTTELNLAKILAANTQAALDRADREQTIEQQRRQLEMELDEVFERIDDAFFALDGDWQFTYANDHAERLLGDDDSGLVGRQLWEAIPEDGHSGLYDALRGSVAAQDPVSVEEYFPDSDSWFEVHAYPSESGLSVYLREVTERKRREQKLEQQNDRLESFAGMLAHELRNPLTIAQIYLQSAVEGDREAGEEVETALDRIEEMVDILLVTARSTESNIDWEAIELQEVAADVWSKQASETAELVLDAEQTIRADPVHVRHLLENLFSNAIEHGRSDVTVRVGELAAGFYVEDDGRGIPADEREAVTEAGYSTGENGIGLGLTFVAQLADTYDWDLIITESETGGARFEFHGVDVRPEK